MGIAHEVGLDNGEGPRRAVPGIAVCYQASTGTDVRNARYHAGRKASENIALDLWQASGNSGCHADLDSQACRSK